MAKGNLFLGQARGSIGDVVFWRGNGEQLSRTRNRRPSNPRTDSQLTTRIILKTCSTAYSKLMYDYANQTFQGAKIGAENQRKFMSANAKILRDYINQGADDMNFNGKEDTAPMLNRYRVSEGNLPAINATVANTVSGSSTITVGQAFTPAGEVPTYQEVCDAFGVAPGTQLTFLLCNIHQGTIAYVQRKRIILSPASGDMSKALFVGGNINDPNPANDTVGLLASFSDNQLHFEAFGDFRAVAVAASFFDGSKWQYSTEQIWYNPTAGLGVHSLSAAIASWQSIPSGSNEYTRQANNPDYEYVSPIESRAVIVKYYDQEDSDIEQKTFSDDECDNINITSYPSGTAYVIIEVRVNGNQLDVLTAAGLPALVNTQAGGTASARTLSINTGHAVFPGSSGADFDVLCGGETVSAITLRGR